MISDDTEERQLSGLIDVLVSFTSRSRPAFDASTSAIGILVPYTRPGRKDCAPFHSARASNE
jgi:hypothetical protein